MRELRMRDMPMLDSDRELLRGEIEGFDDMTLAEAREAINEKANEMFDLLFNLANPSP